MNELDKKLTAEEYEQQIEAFKERELELQEELIDLRTQVFRLRDEIHALKNSRVVGRVIRLKNFVKDALKGLRKILQLLIDAVLETKSFLGRPLSRSFKDRVKRGLKRLHPRNLAAGSAKTIIVENKAWSSGAPLVSVIIPYYNRAETIDDTVNSLAAQTFTGFETLLVDDGSTEEESIVKLKEIQKSNPKVQIIHQKNQGVAEARNNGIRKARGKYIICLDSDDMLDPTFIEKATALLETHPDVALATAQMDMFGVIAERHKHIEYDPLYIYINNTVITAAEFRKEAWSASSGYKSGIGYEDWEFWLSLAEKGYWGKLIAEPLFNYRTSIQSRYIEDKDEHWRNMERIRNLHPGYKSKVKKLLAKRQYVNYQVTPEAAFINLDSPQMYKQSDGKLPNVLVTVPWMTFGGAETLIYNFCREIKDQFNISFVTGLKSEHEWEHKFKEITPNVYHLANLFDDKRLHLEFLSNYIKTRKVDVLNIIHNGFTFEMLPELKRRHPQLKVVVTMFNDRVEYFDQSIGFDRYIDAYVTDNASVANHYKKEVGDGKDVRVIPNGINCYDEFSQGLFDRNEERAALKINDKELAVFFVGRLSEEKNPDVFVEVASKLAKEKNIKFFVIGDGPMRPQIEKMIKALDGDQVSYLGYQAAVARYMSAADVFVLPSSIEGFPLSILEAMAMEVAVVASDVGAVAEVVESGKEGFVVTPGSAKEIAEAIMLLKNDPKLLDSIKKSARAKVEEKYSNTLLGQNYKKLYNQFSK